MKARSSSMEYSSKVSKRVLHRRDQGYAVPVAHQQAALQLVANVRVVGHLLAVKLARVRGIVDPRPVMDAQGKLVAIVTNTLMGKRQQRPRQALGRCLIIRQKPPERLHMRCAPCRRRWLSHPQPVGGCSCCARRPLLITPLQPRYKF